MGKIKDIANKASQYKYTCVLLGIIFAMGIFLRVFHFSVWMPFELDQARDVFVIYDAVHGGFDHLPLLGPQARGRELFLGPIFYYFGFFASMIFGVSPEAVALPDLFFSLCAIPLFYLFARLFFSRFVSVSLTAIVATSLFLVTYGRFAWNPNGMFFWSLVTFYGLLRAYEQKIFHAKWLIVFICGISVLTQLHFIGFIVAPLVAIVYMVMTKMRIPFRVFIMAVCIISLFYMPVIISEVHTHGHNTRMFFSSVAMSEDAESDANVASDLEHDIVEKAFRYIQESSTFYWNILSADNNGRKNIRTDKKNHGYFPLVCDAQCKKALPHHIFALSSFGVSLCVFFYTLYIFYRKPKEFDAEYLGKRKRLLLVFLWLIFGSAFLTLVAYQISPRFFLFLATPFLIILGVLLEAVLGWGKYGRMVVGMIVIAFVTTNLTMSWRYFSAIDQAQTIADPAEWHDIAMNRDDIVTLSQLRMAGEFIESAKDAQESFMIVGDNRYARALYYIVTIEQGDDRALCYMKRGGFDVADTRGMTYFVLAKMGSSMQLNTEMLATHSIQKQKDFGTIALYKLVPHERSTIVNDLSSRCFVR
ncbi:MAG: hypothetical protein WC819_00330 [Parcubacteria group bacterium]|jgi:4-amino-4-deoxy-L-arabinose transferase-like glycosyltransferase